MKKCIFLFFVFCMIANFAAADDKDLCLSIGLEFGVENISKSDDDDNIYYLMPLLLYENSFFNKTLDVYAELEYTFGLTKKDYGDGDEVIPQSIYFDLIVGYNLRFGSASTLSFILENEFDKFIISPRSTGGPNLTGIFTPAVNFNQNFSFGDLFARLGAPLTYFDKGAGTTMGLDFTIGWNSTFGLGIEAKLRTLLFPGSDVGYNGFETIFSYQTGSVYVEVETIFPREISGEGVKITPEFDYSWWNFTFYVKCEFSGIGASGAGVRITPAIGVKYSY